MLGEPGSGVRGPDGQVSFPRPERPLQALPALPWPRGSGRNQLRALEPPSAIPAPGLCSQAHRLWSGCGGGGQSRLAGGPY